MKQILCCLLIATGLGGLPGPVVPCAEAQHAAFNWELIGDQIIAKELAVGFNSDIYVLERDSLFSLNVMTTIFEGLGEIQNAVMEIVPLSVDTILTSSSGFTYRSLDGGETWPVVFTEGGELFASDLDGPNAGALLTRIGDSTGAGYSHDRGATWSRANGLETSNLNHECSSFGELQTGPFAGRLVAGCLAGMAYSDDRGANWNLSNIWVDFTYNGVSMITAQNGVLYARLEDPEPGFGLWSSSDGATWTRVSTIPTAAHLVGVEGGPAPEGTFYAVGHLNGEVYRSMDAGQTWETLPKIYDGPKNVRVNAVILGPDNRLYAAVTGTGPGPQPHWGVYRTTEPVVVANEPPPDVPSGVFTMSVRPNPAVRVATVPFEVTQPAHVTLKVYDVLGREVALLGEGFFDAGYYTRSFDGSQLASGLYIVQATVEHGGGVRSIMQQRIMLLK